MKDVYWNYHILVDIFMLIVDQSKYKIAVGN
ncbi:Uncharacterised protein [Escherichia coli]|nr:Uncharacterised protein [Escherichia coli]CAD5790989.1 Uncharacterised protein [Escherichia coli]CAD5792480.1 Uncharacterised protein [Escherichia coli]